MEGVGERLRKRARDLGLPSAEVARRAGLSAQRYAHYIAGRREPGLATLVRICRVLDVTPNDLLIGAKKSVAASKENKLKARLMAAANALDPQDLQLAVSQTEAIVRHRTAR